MFSLDEIMLAIMLAKRNGIIFLSPPSIIIIPVTAKKYGNNKNKVYT
ncbi:hypothetical protein VCHA38P217_60084 [Vibrio chagasii]|nr:hypothetical protein VCHA36O157_100064 [Vibrio chagasii]CAH6796428.1 hypothetical protein VCHA34P115_100124 [Vibrio chagasii]CAH6818515.1 hypothetical protein VCHA34P120_130077 [Vibrio chagasii]CAH6894649.1 hypothetical protein VCHA41O249_100126 [Vibrio chagasii]CAH6904448.1 hypothetical protein VCHA37P193_110115 [Vibrio chagasii]